MLLQVDEAKQTLSSVKSAAAAEMAAAQGVVTAANKAMAAGISAAKSAGESIKQQAQQRCQAASDFAQSDVFPLAKSAAQTAFNEASAEAKKVKGAAALAVSQAADMLDTACAALESASNGALRWLTALSGDLKKIFFVSVARFHSDWAQMVSTGRIGFTFRGTALGFPLNFDVDVDISHAVDTFQKQINHHLNNLPGLDLCALID